MNSVALHPRSFMDVVELRDPDAARAYLLQGLWLQRVIRPQAPLVRTILGWALEYASSGRPLPPLGFLADVGVVVFGHDHGRQTKDMPEVPGWPATLARNYEDQLLGKLYADWTFERAVDALRRYAEKDHPRGLAYVVRRIQERGGFGGVELSPAIVKGMMQTPGEDLLAEGYESLAREGPLPELVRRYEMLVHGARRMAEVLGPEDLIAIKQRTAIADMGQYVAHRQILTVTARTEARLPPRPVRPLAGRREVPTRILDEDQYPVGGYTSIATKGSIESLLHSQLAYMENDRPDLFDMKFVRDELFYYSRDENQFLRRRRLFVFVFDADLVEARFKDVELPAQRIVMSLSLVLVLVRKLSEWLSTDALRFELLFVAPPEGDPKALAHERELLELLLTEQIERGEAEVRVIASGDALRKHLLAASRNHQVQVLRLATTPNDFEVEGAIIRQLVVDAASPTLLDESMEEAEDAPEAWIAVALRLLELWV